MLGEQDVINEVVQRTNTLLDNYQVLLQCAVVPVGAPDRLQCGKDVLDIARAAEAIAQECVLLQNVVDRLDQAAALLVPSQTLAAQKSIEHVQRRKQKTAEAVAARVAMDVDAALLELEAEYYSPVR